MTPSTFRLVYLVAAATLLAACPLVDDTEAPLVFWTVGASQYVGRLDPMVPQGTHALAVKVVEDGPNNAGIESVTLSTGVVPSLCEAVTGQVGTTTGGAVFVDIASYPMPGTEPAPATTWTHTDSVTAPRQAACDEGYYGTAAQVLYRIDAVDAAGNERKSTLLITVDPTTAPNVADQNQETTTESCSADRVIWLADGGPVVMRKGDQSTFFVQQPDTYWYCASGADYNYEVTRCPAGTNVYSVARAANGDMTIACLRRP